MFTGISDRKQSQAPLAQCCVCFPTSPTQTNPQYHTNRFTKLITFKLANVYVVLPHITRAKPADFSKGIWTDNRANHADRQPNQQM